MLKRKIIVIFGLGNVGRRYLEAIILIKSPINIYVYDKNLNALKLAQKTFFSSSPNLIKNKNFFFSRSIQNNIKRADLAIIATNSDVRKKVFFNILKKIKINKFIFEKVLFQDLKDYNFVYNHFKNNNIKGWVNCHYRYNPLFKKIKKRINKLNNFTIELNGNNWGMGCNSIHFIDFFCYLFDNKVYSMDSSELIKKKFKSKRAGFIEFFGKLSIENDCGNKMYLEDDFKYFGKMNLIIKNKNYYFNYNFITKKISEKINGRLINSIYEMPLLSRSIDIQIKKIISESNCELVNILESIDIHKIMHKSFQEHTKTLYKKDITKLAIT